MAQGKAPGAFELTVGGKLVHSKLTIQGHGKCQTDQELDNIIEAITAAVA